MGVVVLNKGTQRPKLPLYLDYAATTPIDKGVANLVAQNLQSDDAFGNPSSVEHVFGRRAKEAVDNARSQIAQLISCNARELVFTSGATESDNLAVKGAVLGTSDLSHVISLITEHKAVLSSLNVLAQSAIDTTLIGIDESGVLDISRLERELRPNTTLVSIMHVNNETGVIQDIDAIGKLLAGHSCLFHVDAAQSAGKIPIKLDELQVDLLSLSGHKIYGPKGVGALYVRRGVEKKLKPIIDGGGQELGLRSGTLATHQIVGMGAAFKLASDRFEADRKHIGELSNYFQNKFSQIEGVVFNGDRNKAIPNIINISFMGVDAEALMNRMPDIAISSSSACTSGAVNQSYVLQAMGIVDDRLYGAIRFSLGRPTTKEDVDYVYKRVKEEIFSIRSLQ